MVTLECVQKGTLEAAGMPTDRLLPLVLRRRHISGQGGTVGDVVPQWLPR